MFEWVDGQTAGVAGSRVALGIGGKAVSHLVDHDGHDEHHYIEDSIESLHISYTYDSMSGHKTIWLKSAQ